MRMRIETGLRPWLRHRPVTESSERYEDEWREVSPED